MSEEFHRGDWRQSKIDDFKKMIKKIPFLKEDGYLAKKLEDTYANLLDDVLNSSPDLDSKNSADLKLVGKSVILFVGPALYIFNTYSNTMEYIELDIDTSGSSIDDGNKNLYPDISKDALEVLLRSMGGDVIETLTFGKVIKAVGKVTGIDEFFIDAVTTIFDIDFGRFSIGNAVLENHLITIDYKDINLHITQERKYVLYKANPIFDKALNSVWSKMDSDMQTLDRVIFTRYGTPVELIYHKYYKKDTNIPNTFEFRAGSGDDKIISVLRRIDYPKEGKGAYLKTGNNPQKLLTNYYANDGSGANSLIRDLEYKGSDKDKIAIQQAAKYSLKELKGYALQGDNLNTKEYEDLKIYSSKHMDSRLEFFHAVIRDEIAKVSHTEKDKRYNTYTDTKTNTFLWNTNGTFTPAKKIVFVDGKYSSSASGKYDIFGYSNPDTINLTKNADNVYAELGLGSDTITTGSGDDIIYTNVNTEDGGVDTEDKNTTNTVNSGEGDDTIYGSKGIDKITSGKGTNHIYAGGGSDEINVTNSGKNYIYTGISAEGREDKDNESDINTVNLTYGTNEVYGSKGIDLITSENAGKNYIITKDGDDGINIYGGEFNEIFTGKGSDTITINSAKGPNYIYTSTDSKNSEDQDTKDDINTVVITTGQNYIYGGKGVENLHILEGINNADLGNGKNIVDIAGGNNTIVLGENEDTVNITGGTNFIEAGDGKDTITATSGTNTIHAGTGNDTVTTGNGNDIIYSDDYDGDKEDNDTLKGGDGYDKYYVGNGDTIEDSDGDGNVWFKNSYPLSGGIETNPGSKVYKGSGYTYHLNGDELKVVHDSTKESITIRNFNQEKNSLGITLINKVGLKIKDVTKNESDKTADVTIELVGEIVGDGALNVFMKNKKEKFITFKKGDKVKTYKYDISDYDDFIVNSEKIRDAASLTPYRIAPIGVDYDSYSSEFGHLKIKDDDSPLKLVVEGSKTVEAAEKLYTNITAVGNWQKGMKFDVKIGGQIITFDYNNKSKRVKLTTWSDDKIPEENCKFYVRARFWSGNTTVYDSGKRLCIIQDDDRRKNPNDPKYYDPIVIDMDGDGIELLPMNGTINFDHDNNGFREATGWISGDDAFLAFDKNKNGIIDNGSELFGDHSSTNGFEELKKYDLNSDGFINKDDEIWYELVLWQDKNSNGISDEGELTKLSESKIKSIDLRYTNVSREFLENYIKQTTKVIFSDEKTAEAVDVNFKVDLSDTIMPEIEISKDILAMPNVGSKGNLYDLHSAMMMNNSLKDELKKYINANSIERKKLIKSLIYKWAGVENNPTSGRGAMKDARELNVYEILTGEVFIHISQGKNPNSGVTKYLHELYQNFEDYVYAELELQTTYKGVIDTEYMILDEDTGALKYDFKNFKEKILELFNNKKYEEMVILKDLARDASIYKPRLASELNQVLTELSLSNEYMSKMLGNKHIFGDNGNNTINGTSYNDYMNGNDGNDILNGEGGNDILVGAEGNDNLNGGAGDDTYIFAKGDGKDIIDDGSGNDTIEFKEGITKDDLIIKHSSSDIYDLEISIKGTDDSITVDEFFTNSGRDFNRSYMIENFKFSDGTVLSYEDIQNIMLKGDDKNNTIKMSAGSQNSALLEAESASIDNNDFITNDQTNKIIQDLNS